MDRVFVPRLAALLALGIGPSAHAVNNQYADGRALDVARLQPADASCDDVCSMIVDKSGKPKGLGGGIGWAETDDLWCANHGARTNPAVVADPTTKPQTGGAPCNLPLLQGDPSCIETNRRISQCKLRGSQIETKCAAYLANEGATKGEKVVLALDVTAAAACGLACAGNFVPGGAALHTACAAAGASASVTEIIQVIKLKSGKVQDLIALGGVGLGTAFAAQGMADAVQGDKIASKGQPKSAREKNSCKAAYTFAALSGLRAFSMKSHQSSKKKSCSSVRELLGEVLTVNAVPGGSASAANSGGSSGSGSGSSGGAAAVSVAGCSAGKLSDPKAYFLSLIGRAEGSPANDWEAVLRASGLGMGPGSGVRPDGSRNYGITQQINSSGQVRGRVFLPSSTPDENGYYIRAVDVLADDGKGGFVWAWREMGGPAYAANSCPAGSGGGPVTTVAGGGSTGGASTGSGVSTSFDPSDPRAASAFLPATGSAGGGESGARATSSCVTDRSCVSAALSGSLEGGLLRSSGLVEGLAPRAAALKMDQVERHLASGGSADALIGMAMGGSGGKVGAELASLAKATETDGEKLSGAAVPGFSASGAVAQAEALHEQIPAESLAAEPSTTAYMPSHTQRGSVPTCSVDDIWHSKCDGNPSIFEIVSGRINQVNDRIEKLGWSTQLNRRLSGQTK
jgi:hypothetical protein